MISTLISLLLCLALVAASAVHVNKIYTIFMDPVGLALVFGGTLGVAFVTFGPKRVFRLIRTSIAVARQVTDDAPVVAREVVDLAKRTRGDAQSLQALLNNIKFPFLRDGVTLICDKVEYHKIESILSDRIRVKHESDESTANMLRTLAKYPPSFGIIGTVLGLIAMMMQLGTDGGAEKLGPSMAVGLVATLYGLVLTNFVLQPLSENLALKSTEDTLKRQIALLGVLLLQTGERAAVVQEAVNSMLPVSQRIDELGIGGGGRSQGGRAA